MQQLINKLMVDIIIYMYMHNKLWMVTISTIDFFTLLTTHFRGASSTGLVCVGMKVVLFCKMHEPMSWP